MVRMIHSFEDLCLIFETGLDFLVGEDEKEEGLSLSVIVVWVLIEIDKFLKIEEGTALLHAKYSNQTLYSNVMK